MKRGITLGRTTSLLIVLLALAASLGWILSCALPPTIKAPASPERYSFTNFKIPEKKAPASVPLTVAVVNPSYNEGIGLSKFVKSFSGFLASSLDEIIIAKGMTAKGPYENLDMITYPDKKASDLTLTEVVFVGLRGKEWISTDDAFVDTEDERNVLCDLFTYKMKTEIWIALEMREPLTAEKMWIKKINLGEHIVQYQIASKTERSGQGERTRILFNTREDAVAKLLDELYLEIMKTAWDYLNTEEMLVLKRTGEEIRKAKRY